MQLIEHGKVTCHFYDWIKKLITSALQADSIDFLLYSLDEVNRHIWEIMLQEMEGSLQPTTHKDLKAANNT